ncbi:baseplate assembly protein [Desulfovibrio ferrophilus]|uniref:Baseplate J family protein n=1 Tax=Desulfovibrio ferrophilus TaxID=241368 RepID=A0A2Z6AZ29_9BACT|nr:baseplate J/gp47 family protein [Desulfovibrio ferrophilus]BBD08450.1 baseplate J family protein [Desulfovibrio ferrophilus]
MSSFEKIDLSKLPAPSLIEEFSFEQLLEAILADYLQRDPDHSAPVESDPAYKVLETAAHRELILRQRVNEAACAVMLAYASDVDLDNLAAFVPLQRKLVDPGDPDAYPPILPTYEGDEDFRRRVQLAPEGFSVAGPDGAYIFHALAVPEVKDAAVSSPTPGEVVVHVLGRIGDGIPDADVLETVQLVLSASETRPLTDHVTVLAAQAVNYSVQARLYVRSGPSTEAVQATALNSMASLAADRHVLGTGMPLSAVYAALHVEGVARVELASPAVDVNCDPHQAAYCTGIVLEVTSV